MALNEWKPSEDALATIVKVLQDSLVPDSNVQKAVQEKILLMQNYPDFTNYLLYVLSNGQLYDVHVRTLSAIILKNNISTLYETLPSSVIDVVRQQCLELMRDSSREVRTSVTTLIGVLVWKGSISSWPTLIPYLCLLLESSDSNLSETALSALFKICEEYLSKLAMAQEEHNDMINELLSKFVSLVTNERANIRKEALKLLNQVMQDGVDLSKNHFDTKLYMNSLLQILKDDDPEIQKLVCQAFVTFIETGDANILPHIQTVVEYIFSKLEHEDSEVALQGCEFWLASAKLPTCRELFLPYAERLLPILLKNMKYSSYELDALKDHLGIDEHIEDKVDDIQPMGMRSGGGVSDSDEFYEESYYEGKDLMGEPNVGWTLRKCSAASLDALSLQFREDMLPIVIPLINQALNHNDCLIKESGILALGAIADGCMTGLRPYLPGLVQYLLVCMNNENSLIRVITCWTLSRFMSWMMEPEQSTEVYFIPVMTVLLKHFLDGNKRVQRAALSAFCIFQEEARFKLVPYINLILQAFIMASKKFKYRSCLLLYDVVGVLSQSVGNHLNKPEYIQVLLPPLMHKFNSIQNDEDEEFLALMECLSNVVTAVEVGFLPYAEVAYNRCLQILNETVKNILCFNEKPSDYDPPEKDAMCVAHDLLLGMAVGLKTYFVKYVTNSNLLQLMYYTLQEEMVQVRQPALALFGELVKLCFDHINPQIHDYVPIIIENLDKTFDGTCNNAAWVISKLCIVMGQGIEQYIPQILKRYIEIMQTCNGAKTMYQTVAISLCSLGLVCPDIITPYLGNILRPCCQAMRNVRDCEEKDLGFRGLCQLIIRNPSAAIPDFIYFCDAVASWNDIRTDLKEIIRNILITFKNQYGEGNWIVFYEQFPPMLKFRLNKLYGI